MIDRQTGIAESGVSTRADVERVAEAGRGRRWSAPSISASAAPAAAVAGLTGALRGSAVAVDVKFCWADTRRGREFAASLGAAYVGVIFARSPRRADPITASEVLPACAAKRQHRGRVRAGHRRDNRISRLEAALDIVQLHGDPTPGVVERLRRFFGGEVWAGGAHRRRRVTEGSRGLSGVGRRRRARCEGAGAARHRNGFDWDGIARTLRRLASASACRARGWAKPENASRTPCARRAGRRGCIIRRGDRPGDQGSRTNARIQRRRAPTRSSN